MTLSKEVQKRELRLQNEGWDIAVHKNGAGFRVTSRHENRDLSARGTAKSILNFFDGYEAGIQAQKDRIVAAVVTGQTKRRCAATTTIKDELRNETLQCEDYEGHEGSHYHLNMMWK